ncbi:diaminopimelate epimerase [Spirochaetia bacterium]|nr:diaminopimelate epimerase [Spirochaetia bacterium]
MQTKQNSVKSIIIANPAGNITAFVSGGQNISACERIRISNELLADKTLKVEQVGFIIEPEKKDKLWRLEMMGGEFCGNAARSFGLWTAKQLNLNGKGIVKIEISGASAPAAVEVDMETHYAKLELPAPYANSFIAFNGESLPVYFFEGITHIIACNIPPDAKTFFAIKTAAESSWTKLGQPCPEALGVMFYDENKKLLSPAVFVYRTGTLVFESSCGSGSAAFVCFFFEEAQDTAGKLPITQPGGIIEAGIEKKNGKILSITIGGNVGFS